MTAKAPIYKLITKRPGLVENTRQDLLTASRLSTRSIRFKPKLEAQGGEGFSDYGNQSFVQRHKILNLDSQSSKSGSAINHERRIPEHLRDVSKLVNYVQNLGIKVNYTGEEKDNSSTGNHVGQSNSNQENLKDSKARLDTTVFIEDTAGVSVIRQSLEGD